MHGRRLSHWGKLGQGWIVCINSQENAGAPNRILLGIWKGELHLSKGQRCALIRGVTKCWVRLFSLIHTSFEHLLVGGPMTTHLNGRPWDTGQSRRTTRICILTQSYHHWCELNCFWTFFINQQEKEKLCLFVFSLPQPCEVWDVGWFCQHHRTSRNHYLRDNLLRFLSGTWWGDFPYIFIWI